jgi:hypothetical protein
MSRSRIMRAELKRNKPRSRGKRSKIPPKIIEQIARDVSAGIPTSHGNQYFFAHAAAQ